MERFRGVGASVRRPAAGRPGGLAMDPTGTGRAAGGLAMDPTGTGPSGRRVGGRARRSYSKAQAEGECQSEVESKTIGSKTSSGTVGGLLSSGSAAVVGFQPPPPALGAGRSGAGMRPTSGQEKRGARGSGGPRKHAQLPKPDCGRAAWEIEHGYRAQLPERSPGDWVWEVEQVLRGLVAAANASGPPRRRSSVVQPAPRCSSAARGALPPPQRRLSPPPRRSPPPPRRSPPPRRAATPPRRRSPARPPALFRSNPEVGRPRCPTSPAKSVAGGG